MNMKISGKEYIERNDLIKNLNTFAPECYNALINDLIMKQPAADVAPVKRGHWIQVDKNKCECSNCGIIVLIAVYPHGDKNYCPNCGAKMDKGSEENNNG